MTCLSLSLSGAPLPAETNTLDVDAIAEYVSQTFHRDRVPGGAVAIVRNNDLLFLRGFGHDGLGQPIDEETGFVIGSMSKAFTALVAMRLIVAGNVTLETPIGAHLETFHATWQGTTLGQLLTHTSGLPNHTPSLSAEASLAQHAEALAKLPLKNAPGTRHVYSSGNYLLAARVLETSTSTRYENLLQEQVLAPLGIMQRDDGTPVPLGQRSAIGHQYWGLWPNPMEMEPEPGRLATASLVASLRDMATFVQFQLGDGTWEGRPLLSAESLAEMHKGTAQGEGFTYGLGWREVDLGGVRTVQHGGVVPAFQGKMILLPEQDIGIVVLTNVSSVLPMPVQPTSHRLADGLALHLMGHPLELPTMGNWAWLVVIWSGLVLVFLHQAITLGRIVWRKDPSRAPRKAALGDLLMVLSIIFVLPWALGVPLRSLIVQTPDLALWLGAIMVMSLASAAFRILR